MTKTYLSRLLPLLFAALVLAAAPLAARAEDPSVIRVDLANQAAAPRVVAIPAGRSAVIDLPVDARDVMVTNPAVAQAVLHTSRRISIIGVAPGATDAAFFDASGRRILALTVRVDQDFAAVADTIGRIVPGSRVHVEGVKTSLVLSGEVASAADASRAVQIAQQFVPKPEDVLNMLSITGKDQVMLKVRIVEVQRNIVKQLGFNLGAAVGAAGSPQYSFATAASFAINGSLLGGLAGSGYNFTAAHPSAHGINSATATVDAFERVGLVRTLAEPNLTAESGEAAKFLAGGEFPVPTGEDNTGRVTVEFKPYGVGLGFTPVVLSGGRISMKVSTEVSELTNIGAFTLATGSATTAALTIPALTVRRAETSVEMPSGGSMMIAGLLQNTAKEDLDSLPGLTNLPVLGALFRSRDFQSGETELVVIVTPYIVSPTSPNNLQTPVDGLHVANDAQTIFMGQLNKVYKTPPGAVAGRTYQGPVGYVIQ
jgi:pilus assembly protein CpaC